MGEEVTFPVNDTNREIGEVLQKLRAFESPLCDPRVKALVLTNLEQAQLWSLKLIKPEEL
jgi:hypothetical protein